ncbi:MAG: type II toxin-antitoxin system RelE/ParE family toxin [Verrucomicrobiota bacterium]
MRIKISDDAERDMERGWLFYEKQSVGVGEYFLDTIHAEIDSLILYAGIHRIVHGMHRLLVQRFPFAIYYELQGDLVYVWAVFDCRSDPKKMGRGIKRRSGSLKKR